MDSYEVQIAVKFCDSLNKLLGGKGKNLWITAPFYVDYGNNIYFGNNCEVNMNCTFLDDNIINLYYPQLFFVNNTGFLSAYLKHHLESADHSLHINIITHHRLQIVRKQCIIDFFYISSI